MGFSHAGTTFSILSLNTIIIGSQILAWYLGASVDVQLYIVIALSVAFTIGLYHTLYAVSDNSIIKRCLRKFGKATHIERKGIALILQRLMDKI